MGTDHEGPTGNRDWSETTEERKVAKPGDPPRWYPTDSDRVERFGPYSEDLKHQIASHWCLCDRRRDALPRAFGRLTQSQFTGAPFGNEALTACFADHSGGEVELVPVERLWSVPDGARIEVPYRIANVYGTAATVDTKRTSVMKIPTPMHGKPYNLSAARPKDIHVHPGAQGDRHVWRDAATGRFFCDDVFRAAIEDVAPRTYEFTATTSILH